MVLMGRWSPFSHSFPEPRLGGVLQWYRPVIQMLFPGFAFTIFPGNWPLGISSVIAEFDSGRGGWGRGIWAQPRSCL
jgi:hypothetical protein